MPPPRLSSRPWLMDAALIGCSCLTDRYEGRPCQPPYYPNRFICSTGGTGSFWRAREGFRLGKASPGGSVWVSPGETAGGGGRGGKEKKLFPKKVPPPPPMTPPLSPNALPG